MKLTIVIPTMARWEQCFKTVELFLSMAKDVKNLDIMVCGNIRDKTIPKEMPKYESTRFFFAENRCKIDGYNLHLDEAKGDVFLTAADDLIPLVVGYEEIILSDMAKHFPDTDGALYYYDGVARPGLCTHPVIGKKYLKRFGYIFHPSYLSVYNDDEFTTVGKRLGLLKEMEAHPFFHDHYSVGNRPRDWMNDNDDKNATHDRENFTKRSMQNFPL